MVLSLLGYNSTNIYLFKVNNWNTKRRCEICFDKISSRRSGVFIVNFEHISNLWLQAYTCLLGNLNIFIVEKAINDAISLHSLSMTPSNKTLCFPSHCYLVLNFFNRNVRHKIFSSNFCQSVQKKTLFWNLPHLFYTIDLFLHPLKTSDNHKLFSGSIERDQCHKMG